MLKECVEHQEKLYQEMASGNSSFSEVKIQRMTVNRILKELLHERKKTLEKISSRHGFAINTKGWV